MANYQPTYTFIPEPFYDENEKQWKPSVRELLDGKFNRHTVYDLGFDEPRFTMPYAREFAQNEADWCRRACDMMLQEFKDRGYFG